jgi:putative transcriptional regulator
MTGRRSVPARSPRPAAVAAARSAANLTQAEAGALVYCSRRGWQDWESGARRMHPAFWELWRQKAAALPAAQ